MKFRSLFRADLQQWTTKELLDAFRRQGDGRFFDELFERYHLTVYGWCMRLLQDRAESKDQAIIIFQKAHRALRSTEVENLETWLATLCRNQCIDHLRRRNRETELAESWGHWEKSDEKFVENEAFVRLISEEEDEMEEWVLEELRQLPAMQGRCLELFYWERKPYREIAGLTGLSLSQVKSHLQNGKRQLGKLLVKRREGQKDEKE